MKKILQITTASAIMSFSAFAMAETSINIGTGGETGVYYQAGQNICKLVNRAKVDINCTSPSTGGSIANINGINAGDLQFGMAQSDWQYHASHGTSKFEEQGKNEKLRSVFSLYPEPFTVVARKDAKVKTFADLKGKRVNIASPNTGTRGTMDEILAGLGWDKKDFKAALELKLSEAAQALCDNNIDAYAYAVGSPAASISEATTTCDANLVPLTDPETMKVVDDLTSQYDYYAKAVVPGGLYRGNDKDTETFGVGATLVSSSDVPEEVVYNLVKVVFENFDRFKRAHPAFANMEKEKMVSDFNSAPLHPGAEKYYKEVGLIK